MLDEGISAFLDDFMKESDRGAAIIGAAYLEEALGDLIAEYWQLDGKQYNELLNSESNAAPLGGLWAKILLSHALRLISTEQREALKTINRTRNQFAHKRAVSFQTRPISDWCILLREYAKANHIHNSGLPNSRVDFLIAVAFLLGSFKDKGGIIKSQSLHGTLTDLDKRAAD